MMLQRIVFAPLASLVALAALAASQPFCAPTSTTCHDVNLNIPITVPMYLESVNCTADPQFVCRVCPLRTSCPPGKQAVGTCAWNVNTFECINTGAPTPAPTTAPTRAPIWTLAPTAPPTQAPTSAPTVAPSCRATPCPPNMYQSSTAGDCAAEACVACGNLTCAPGEYQTGRCGDREDGLLCLPCAPASCSDGHVRTGVCDGRTNSYDCVACDQSDPSACSNDQYAVSSCAVGTDGTPQTEHVCRACDNLLCGVGTYQVGSCSASPPLNGLECLPCSNATCGLSVNGDPMYRTGECLMRNNGFQCAACANSRCPVGQYRVGECPGSRGVKNDFDCLDWAPGCADGTYVLAGPTETSDMVCAACAPGTFSGSGEGVHLSSTCASWAPSCRDGTFEAAGGTATSDRLCEVTAAPSLPPTRLPTSATPTQSPASSAPSVGPTVAPTDSPTPGPTVLPTTSDPSAAPTALPSTSAPTARPSVSPTTSTPTAVPTRSPSVSPTVSAPTGTPTAPPSTSPSASPTTSTPTSGPTVSPSASPTLSQPTVSPATTAPTRRPTRRPTASPSVSPTTSAPSTAPTDLPSASPTSSLPTAAPASSTPTLVPSSGPTVSPSTATSTTTTVTSATSTTTTTAGQMRPTPIELISRYPLTALNTRQRLASFRERFCSAITGMLALGPAQCEVVNVDLATHAVVFWLRSRDPVQLGADFTAALSPAGLNVPPFDWVPASSTGTPAATAPASTTVSAGVTAGPTEDEGAAGADPAGGSSSGDGGKDDDGFSLLQVAVFAVCVIVVATLIGLAAGQFCHRATRAATPRGGTHVLTPDYGSQPRASSSPLSYGEGSYPGGGDHFVSIHALAQYAESQTAAMPVHAAVLEADEMYDPAAMAGMPHRSQGGRRLSYMDEQSIANPVFTGPTVQQTAA